jgi:hypothetical protein
LFDLAEHPEIVPELSKEISQVRQEVGGKDADASTVLNPTYLAKLHKMDSLFKESQRFRHANLRMYMFFDLVAGRSGTN